jgi:hypothetical protein
MEYLEMLWDLLVTTGLLYGASRLLPGMVRCKAPEGALKAAVLHAIAYRMLSHLAFFLALVPAMFLVAIPVVGPYLVALMALGGVFLVSVLSLWLAQLPLEDFTIDTPYTAALVVFGMVTLRFMVAISF